MAITKQKKTDQNTNNIKQKKYQHYQFGKKCFSAFTYLIH